MIFPRQRVIPRVQAWSYMKLMIKIGTGELFAWWITHITALKVLP
jgi:hypothetical protein